MTEPTANRPWLGAYPAGVPADIHVAQYPSLVHLLEESFQKNAPRTAYSFMGKDVSFAQTDSLSQAFAAYLQGLGLVKGDRVAIMMPNVPQYPAAVAGILRAGFVVVNVNPLYTPRELEHQLKDSGAKVIVIIENFASTMNFVIFPMFFMSSALYPLWKLKESGAEWLYWVATVNPFTHMVELVRYAMYEQLNLTSLAVVGGSTLVFFAWAAYGYDPQRGMVRKRQQA